MLLAVGAAMPAFLLCMWLHAPAFAMRCRFPSHRLDLKPDWRALLFTFVLTGVTGLAFGLAPALQATRPSLVPALKEGGNVQLRKFRRLSLRNGLVLCQMAAFAHLLLLTGYTGARHPEHPGRAGGFNPRNLT